MLRLNLLQSVLAGWLKLLQALVMVLTLQARLLQHTVLILLFTDEKKTKDWSFHDGLWWSYDKIVVPDCRANKEQILHEFHKSNYAGHSATHKTVNGVLRYFPWTSI